MTNKVKVITGILGDRNGTWVSYEDYKLLEAGFKELQKQLDGIELAYYQDQIPTPEALLKDEDIPF